MTEDTQTIEDSKRALAREQTEAFRKAMETLGYDRAEIIALLQEEA